MLKKPITYTDFNDNLVTEDFFFNLTKTEITEFEFSDEGGFTGKMVSLGNDGTNAELLAFFIELLQKSYGIKSADGKRFVKSPEIWADFKSHAAYDALFEELVLSPNSTLLEFVKGLFPQELSEAFDKAETLSDEELLRQASAARTRMNERPSFTRPPTQDHQAPVRHTTSNVVEEPTPQETVSMTREEFDRLRRGEGNTPQSPYTDPH